MINRRKDGSLYYEEMTLTPLLNAQGETEHIIAIKQDITERKDAEEALKLANAEVLKASQLKSQLLANVSHELRTPLSAIVGFAEMLNADVYGEVSLQQSRVLEDILDSSNRLLFFVNNLIDRAQIDVGKIVLHQSRFQITDLVETAKLTVGGIAEKKGLQVDYEVDLNLPHTLYGDLYWLRQIVQNLMANAVKFTDKGSVRFRLEKKSGDTWAIEVKDTGIGIPKDETQSIFEPFHQVDSSPTRSRAGSGLGLSIVKELVSLMRGVVRLETEMGVGSCFTIILPLNRGE
jgi:signal transduction histidine kinase